jgi:1,2-diacylglycerol 3-beta-galactosyltransferase
VYKFGYKATDGGVPTAFMKSGLQVILYRVMRWLLDTRPVDLIISTYPLYPDALGAVFSITKKYVPLVTVVTDLLTVHRIWFSAYSDLTIVPTAVVRDRAIEAGIPAQRIAVIGIPVHPRLGKESLGWTALRAVLGWDGDLTTVLMVGGKRGGLSVETAQALNRSGLPLQLILIAGGDRERYRALRKMKWLPGVRVYDFVKDMSTMMRAADCIICKAGGLTVTESLAAGLPLLLTDVIPGQETGNAWYVVEGGAGEMVDGPLSVLNTVRLWMATGGLLLRKRAANAVTLGRPHAASDIADFAWALAQGGPVEKKTPRLLVLPRLIELAYRKTG